MINIGLYYRVKAGHENEFEDFFLDVVSSLKDSNLGLSMGKLYREVGESGEYMLYTEWDSPDSFKKFIESKEYARAVEFGKSITEGKPRHRSFS